MITTVLCYSATLGSSVADGDKPCRVDMGNVGFITSGMAAEEHQRFVDLPGGPEFFAYLSSLPEPLRVADFSAYTTALGLPEIGPPLGPVKGFLGAPIRHRGRHIGNLYLSDKEGGLEFTQEDEDTLLMFASQAAMAIANARRYREEQRARADLETLVNTCPVGVVVFDAKTGAPSSLNREGRRIVDGLRNPDQSAEELLQTLTYRRADGREISLQEFPIAEALSTGETIRTEEIVMQVPDGRSVTTIINATPILSEEGELESVVVTLQDMTAVEELERLRAEFLGMVSHELRAPLTSIKGSAATVLGSSTDLDPAVIRQFFRIIEEQADHMHGLVADLLDVARIETGTLPVSPEPAEVAALVDRARSTFISAGGRNNLVIGFEPDLPLVMADRLRIVQVIGNLLSNAARHSPESSAIRVSAVREGLHVAFAVADEGRGIPSERLPFLFRKFTRIEGDERGSGFLGSGLGLAICKGIVEAHGGRIWAESEGPDMGDMTAGPEGVVRFYNGRGTAEQWIKEGKYALNWTRLSCHRFVANRVRLSLFVLAYNLGNFLRRLCLPKTVKHWSLQSVQVKLIKMGGRLVRHSRRLIFQLAEVSVPRRLFQGVLDRIGRLSPAPS